MLVAADFRYDLAHCEVAAFLHREDADYLHLGSTPQPELPSLSPREARARIAAGRYRLALIGNPVRLWNPRKALLSNTSHLLRHLARGGSSTFQLRPLLALLQRHGVPIGGIDRSDRPIIDNARFPILAASRFFFKRELPLNPANAFLYTGDRAEDTGNIARIPFFCDQLSKLEPLPLGISDAHFADLQQITPERKEIDILFAGSVVNRPLRKIGLAALERLKAEGYNVVALDHKLSRRRYFALLATSHLCWSPEGFGFDCYRTYEAAALGVVPVLKHPPIVQHQPLEEGGSAIYYRHETQDFYEKVKRALDDRRRLIAMGEAAREHIRTFHLSSRVAAAVVEKLIG